jgi:hypothetical protein
MTHEVDEIIAMAAVGHRWVLRYRLATGEAAGSTATRPTAGTSRLLTWSAA